MKTFASNRDGSAGFAASGSSVNLNAVFRSAHVEWGTPPDLRESLDKEFAFTLDPCTPGQVWDGREMSWAGQRVFCNPPYGKGIEKWLAKGREAELAVFLVPARTDTKWFHDHALKADEIRFIRGRLKFKEKHIEPDMDHQNAAPFPSMLVIYRMAVLGAEPSNTTDRGMSREVGGRTGIANVPTAAIPDDSPNTVGSATRRMKTFASNRDGSRHPR